MKSLPTASASVAPVTTADELVAAAITGATATFATPGTRGLTALRHRMAATPDHGPPLVRAVRRWRLDEGELELVLLVVGSELGPRALKLAMEAAGDPIRPGVTVEAAALALGIGVQAIVRMLAPGRPLVELGLVALRSPELPLHRRTLAISPRVIDIALGAAGPDPTTAASLVAPASGQPLPPHEGVHAVLAGRGAIGVVRAGRAALRTLARHAADDGAELLAVELSALAEEPRARAVARDAVFLGAAVAIGIDVGARDLARAARALDRLAASVPVFLVGGTGEPVPLASGVVDVAIAAPGPDELAAAVRARFAAVLDERELAIVAQATPCDLDAIARAGAVVALRELPLARAEGVLRAIAEQAAPLEGGPGLRLPTAHPPLPAAIAAQIAAVGERWRACTAPRRLRVLVSGRPGVGKSTVAAALAARLQLPAIAFEPRQLQRGPEHEAIASVLAIVARGAAALVVENLELARVGRQGPDPTFAAWLLGVPGLVVVTTNDSLASIDTSTRREIDAAIDVPQPDEADQIAIWEWRLRQRGWVVPRAELLRFVQHHGLTAAQIERVVALADRRDLAAEAERRAALAEGRS